MEINRNAKLLTEVNESQSWFHAKKTKPIWAKLIEKDGEVQTMEGKELVKKGDYLCRGVVGEFWPQKAKSLRAKYVMTDEVEDGWTKCDPHPNAKGVMAAEIGHTFQVLAAWGELSGKAGDFLVKNFEDANAEYPDDVWIVDAKLFDATYERVE